MPAETAKTVTLLSGPDISVYRFQSAAAGTNSTLVKSSRARLFKLCAFNASASVKFLKVYNRGSAPTVGSVAPVLDFPIPVGYWEFETTEHGLQMPLGIAFGITGAVGATDSTAVAAGDIVGLNMLYL